MRYGVLGRLVVQDDGHEPGMPVHYDLHIWTHEASPDGVFATWNRKVTC